MAEYTPSLDEGRGFFSEGFADAHFDFDSPHGDFDNWGDALRAGEAAYNRLIEAVRQEEREKAAQIADEVDRQAERDLGIEYDGHAAEVAARIRAQGKEQG